MTTYDEAVSQYEAGQQKFQEIITQDGVTSYTFPGGDNDNPEVNLYFTGGVKEAKLVAGTIVRSNNVDTSRTTLILGDDGSVAHYSNGIDMYVKAEKVFAGFVCNDRNGNGVVFTKCENRSNGNAREIPQEGSLLSALNLIETKFKIMKKYAR